MEITATSLATAETDGEALLFVPVEVLANSTALTPSASATAIPNRVELDFLPETDARRARVSLQRRSALRVLVSRSPQTAGRTASTSARIQRLASARVVLKRVVTEKTELVFVFNYYYSVLLQTAPAVLRGHSVLDCTSTHPKGN